MLIEVAETHPPAGHGGQVRLILCNGALHYQMNLKRFANPRTN